jgi:hypothetical protein
MAATFVLSFSALAAEEGMPRMPKIAPKKIFPIESTEQGNTLLEQRGFGDQEPAVRMMNLMMVGGSRYEGMSMEQSSASSTSPAPAEGQTATYDIQSLIHPEPPHVGANILDIDVHVKNGGAPARGLKITAHVYMTSMNMGTEELSLRAVSPGKYQAKVSFSMAGVWAVKILLPEGGEKTLTFNVK